jgi:hypothetical protein
LRYERSGAFSFPSALLTLAENKTGTAPGCLLSWLACGIRPGVAYFTKENAAQFALKGVETRKQLKEERRLTLEAMRSPSEDFREDLLKQTRAQARIISARIDKALERPAVDHKELTALAATLATFESIEQKLSMRAGPGNLKPSAPRKARTGSFQPPPPADDDGPG